MKKIIISIFLIGTNAMAAELMNTSSRPVRVIHSTGLEIQEYKRQQEELKRQQLQQQPSFLQLQRKIMRLLANVSTQQDTAAALDNFIAFYNDLHEKYILKVSADQFATLKKQYNEAAQQIKKDIQERKTMFEIKACLDNSPLQSVIARFNALIEKLQEPSMEDID